MGFIKFAIFRFSFFLILGIISGHFIKSAYWFYILPAIVLIIGILWWYSKRQLFQKVYFGIATYLCLFTLGLVNYQIRLPQFQPHHYTNYLSESEQPFILEVREILKPDPFNYKCIAEVHTISERDTHGRILLQIPLDSIVNSPVKGDRLFVFSNPSEIPSSLNPHQFDYARFMRINDVYHQMKLTKAKYRILADKSHTLTNAVDEFRRNLLNKLESSPFGNEEKGIIEALVLGYRHSIDRELYEAYAAAGAIHILAVSGLHVGIIYFLLQLLLRPLQFFPHGKMIRVVLLVSLLWAYATLTGLSPSVSRAVTMFSFFGMAQLLNRPTSSINTLFLSLFFLLLWNPKWLFHVGFQMSYLAVFFILWIQPKLYRLYHPKYFIDKSAWTIITVSLAAQIGVAPLSIYYFNQFPGLFLLSNLVILPFAGVMVSLGLLIISLISMDILPDWMAEAFNAMISVLNDFVKWVSVQDQFLFSEIHLSGYQLFGSYLVIITLVLLWGQRFISRTVLCLFSILVFAGTFLLDRLESSKSQFIVFHKNRSSLIGIQQGNRLMVMKRNHSKEYVNEYPIKTFRTVLSISDYSELNLPRVFTYDSKTFMVVDSSGVYPVTKEADIILLCDSPEIHLERLIDCLKPRVIVADGSNYRSFVERWRATCELKKLPFHHTGDRGAFTLE